MGYDERVDVFADAGITKSDLEAAWEIVKNGPARKMVTVEEYDAAWYRFSSPRLDGRRAFAHLSGDMGMPQMYVTVEDNLPGSGDVYLYRMSGTADSNLGEPKEVLPLLAEQIYKKEIIQQCRFLGGGIGPGDGTHNMLIMGGPTPDDVAKIEELIKHEESEFVDQVLVASSDRLIDLGLNDGDRFAGCEIIAVDEMGSRLSIYPRGLFRLRYNTRFEFEATSPKSVVTARMQYGRFSQTPKLVTPALYILSEWVSLTLADDRSVFGVSWDERSLKMYGTEMERVLDEARNLGVAAELYEKARLFWLKNFNGLTVDALLRKGLEAGSTENAIIETVMESEVEDKEHAAQMLMVVITYTLGFG